MTNYSDKNILIIRNKDKPSFLSANGEIAKIGDNFITYKNNVKFIKEGSKVEKQNIEILKIGTKKVIIYNAQTKAWWISK